ncbi:hypothetical protein PGTUg99_010261 [Puccinia graminis f. sp. tritici]|uniref:Uncharacterized protein n=1 Tax=Puccinia graminis f. sp. tritici TaxID=56615 RepID=A0A5B0LMG8_PUCGR|nr:hypothetical protein PGTUg99_010261 [Puccinia graminis f. sp. tritici]
MHQGKPPAITFPTKASPPTHVSSKSFNFRSSTLILVDLAETRTIMRCFIAIVVATLAAGTMAAPPVQDVVTGFESSQTQITGFGPKASYTVAPDAADGGKEPDHWTGMCTDGKCGDGTNCAIWCKNWTDKNKL